jgi:hypothetical protein
LTLGVRALIWLGALPTAAWAAQQPMPRSEAQPLALSDVRGNYEALSGHSIAVQGFVVFWGTDRPLFYQGEIRPNFTMGSRPGIEGRMGFACMAQGLPVPIEVRDLDRHDLWRLARRVRHGGQFIGQRVVLQAVLRPQSQRPLRYGPPIEFAPWDRLTGAHILSVDDVYCAGVQLPPGQ